MGYQKPTNNPPRSNKFQDPIKDERRFDVHITDKRMRSYNMTAVETHLGDVVQISQAYR